MANTLLRDEARDKNVLRLYKLAEPRKLWTKGDVKHYAVHYLWLSPSGGVQGDEWSYWTKAEGQRMEKAVSLFDEVNLF